MQFGLNMLGQLGASGGNVVFSPDSIEAALAMAGVGAAGDTAAQMATALQLPSTASFPDVGALQGTLQSEQATAGAGDADAPTLQIANGMFVQQGFTLEDPFVSTLGTDFGATPQTADFRTQPQQSQDLINSFISQHTASVIPEALPQPLDVSTVLALVNAVYLKARWQSTFNQSADELATFTAAPGPETVPFMYQTEMIRYYHPSGYAVAELPYKASTLSLMVVLPDPGVSVSRVAAELDAPTLAQDAACAQPQPVTLTMPRFHIAFSNSIIPTLRALGMTDAFDPQLADFSNIAAPAQLYIRAVQHAADFTVDEHGTVAAAATVVGASLSAGFWPPPVPFDADRPFLFFLRDNTTGALLFAGQLTDAASATAPPASS